MNAYARALERVQREFERTTDELIRALFLQAREQSAPLALRVQGLERKRDELQDRLEQLETLAGRPSASSP